MVTVPINNYGLNNILGITPSYAAFIHSDPASHQFLGSPAVSLDGTLWVSYQTYSSSLQKASSVSSALARIPPNWTPTLSWVARGLATYSYNPAFCGETVNCVAAGDYLRVAASADNSTRAMLPVIQQPQLYTGQYQNAIFGSVVEARGYNVVPPYVAEVLPIEPAPRTTERTAESIATPIRVGTDYYLPATQPPKVMPLTVDAKMVKYKLGVDLTSIGVPVPAERLGPSIIEIMRAKRAQGLIP